LRKKKASVDECSADVEPDERIAEVIEHRRETLTPNGLWSLNVLHADRIAFDMDAGVGRASYWITLCARRVLDRGPRKNLKVDLKRLQQTTIDAVAGNCHGGPVEPWASGTGCFPGSKGACFKEITNLYL